MIVKTNFNNKLSSFPL